MQAFTTSNLCSCSLLYVSWEQHVQAIPVLEVTWEDQNKVIGGEVGMGG